MELLAHVDQSHGNLRGPATKRILDREFNEYSQLAYERLAGISVAQIYRFRGSAIYRKRNASYQPTRPTPIPIGQRRKPLPQGRPGYLRIDTVHQGDRDRNKGLYHINAVDEVTQWEIVAATPQISENWLIPVLERLREQFPFRIRGFIPTTHINFHRPCAVARIVEEPNGKRRRVYTRWATPWEIFRKMAQCEIYLRPGVSMAELERFAKVQSDTAAAIDMQRAKRQLLAHIDKHAAGARWK